MIKIADFGFCIIDSNKAEQKDQNNEFVGSPIYMAPEVL
jgi:serine/threonine protein kinase